MQQKILITPYIFLYSSKFFYLPFKFSTPQNTKQNSNQFQQKNFSRHAPLPAIRRTPHLLLALLFILFESFGRSKQGRPQNLIVVVQ
jgi:hypothetical protein